MSPASDPPESPAGAIAAPTPTTAAASLVCRRCATAIEAGDLRCSVCSLTVPEAAREAVAASSASAQPSAKILRCRECGAAVSFTIEKQAPSCGFCGSVMAVEQPVDPVEQAEWIVPFTVDYDAARASLRRWLGSLGWFRPSDLASSATVDTLHPLHWAAWVFDAEALVSWAADSDAGSGRAAWAPHAGSTHFSWNDIVVSASRGLTLPETTQLVAGFRLQQAQPAGQPAQPEQPGQGAPRAQAQQLAEGGSAIERFDLQRSAARKKILEAVEAVASAQLQRGHIPGSRFRNVHTSVLLERLATRRMALPTWVLTYRYKGSLYRALVHGQDPALAFGAAPLSWAKIALVALAGVALVALIFALLGS